MPRVLVIEDNPQNWDLISRVLRSRKHAAINVTSIEEGLTVIEKEPPELLILDLLLRDFRLPDVSDPQTVALLRQFVEVLDIPIIYIGDRPSDVIGSLALDFPKAQYIAKPFDYTELKVAVDTALHITRPPNIPSRFRREEEEPFTITLRQVLGLGSPEPLATTERKMIEFRVDQTWTAKQLSEFIDDIDFLYTMLFLSEYGSEDRTPLLEASETGDTSITPDNIHLLLTPEQRLVVDHVSISSPGVIGFDGVADIIHELRGLVKDIISIPKTIRDRKINREIEEKKKLDELEEIEYRQERRRRVAEIEELEHEEHKLLLQEKIKRLKERLKLDEEEEEQISERARLAVDRLSLGAREGKIDIVEEQGEESVQPAPSKPVKHDKTHQERTEDEDTDEPATDSENFDQA